MLVVADAFVIAKVPGQRPVIGRDDRDAGVVAGFQLPGDAVDLAEHCQHPAPRVGIDVCILIVVVMNEVKLIGLIAANRDNYHDGRNRQASLLILTQFLISRFQRIAASQRQRHNKVESDPRRFVSNQRVGGEQAEGPLRQKQRQPIVGAPHGNQRTYSTED